MFAFAFTASIILVYKMICIFLVETLNMNKYENIGYKEEGTGKTKEKKQVRAGI